MYQLKMWDHVQLSAPKGSEDKARYFYCNQLGFNEVEKPESLRGNGGVGLILIKLIYTLVLKKSSNH